jgi:type VI secretion system lysozyme-like protein
VREPRPIPGAKVPLFDRLFDEGINVRQPQSSARVLDLAALCESVRDDLSRLLNTRSSLRGRVKAASLGTVIDYGTPNLSPFAPNDEPKRNDLANSLEKIIKAYEPRLRNVKVVLQPDKTDPRIVLGVVYANLVFGNIVEPVYFPLSLEESGQKVDVVK